MKPVSLSELETVYSHRPEPLKSHHENGDQMDKESTIKEDKEERYSKEVMLLRESDGKALAKILDAPELVAEVERAVYQVKLLLEQKPKT